MPDVDVALWVIAIAQILGMLVLGIGLAVLAPRLAALTSQFKTTAEALQAELRTTAAGARQAMSQVELLVLELRKSGLTERAVAALDSANTAAGRFDPLAQDVASTLGNARELMDDAAQTSQSVRNLADDLAATNKELSALSSSLADIAAGLRDNELAAKLTNVLSDTSVLAADIGVLAENANTYLETGKPIVAGIRALSNARKRLGQLRGSTKALKDSMPPSRDEVREAGS